MGMISQEYSLCIFFFKCKMAVAPQKQNSARTFIFISFDLQVARDNKQI